MTTLVQLYTANHSTTTGITDLMKVIMCAGRSHGVEFEISNLISSQTVLFIDEFSSRSELKKLLKIKKKKNTNFVLISTEFETETRCGPSFNEFSEENKIWSLLVSWISALLYITPKRLRNLKILARVGACLVGLIFFPVLFLVGGWRVALEKVRTFKRSVYMKARRRGYEEFKAAADLVIQTHERLTGVRDGNVLYPVLEKACELENKKIKASGTQTNYRLEMCNMFSRRLEQQNEKYDFEYDGTIKFDQSGKNEVYGFAYQPAQSKSWERSNPIKIWRDYFLHGALPIVDRKFGEHPIEAIAITTEEFFSRQFDLASVNDSFEYYSQSVHLKNADIFREIVSLDRAGL
jgi:hypothetical protein